MKFTAQLAKGQTKRVNYYPFEFILGPKTFTLALHRALDGSKEWSVSDPGSGAKVAHVTGSYKGVPCSTRNFTVALATESAIITLHDLVRRVGVDTFLNTMEGI